MNEDCVQEKTNVARDLLDIPDENQKARNSPFLIFPHSTNSQSSNDDINDRKRKSRPDIYNFPKSDVLARAMAFLPKIDLANKDLEEKMKTKPEQYRIEAIDENKEEIDEESESQYIEMNLVLGVLEEKKETNEIIIPQRNEENDDDVQLEILQALQKPKRRKITEIE